MLYQNYSPSSSAPYSCQHDYSGLLAAPHRASNRISFWKNVLVLAARLSRYPQQRPQSSKKESSDIQTVLFDASGKALQRFQLHSAELQAEHLSASSRTYSGFMMIPRASSIRSQSFKLIRSEADYELRRASSSTLSASNRTAHRLKHGYS